LSLTIQVRCLHRWTRSYPCGDAARGGCACVAHAGCCFPAGIPVKWSTTGLTLTQGGGGNSGQPIPADVIHHAALISDLCTKARSTCQRLFHDEVLGWTRAWGVVTVAHMVACACGVQDPDSSALKYIRMRTKENELIVAPGSNAALHAVVSTNRGSPLWFVLWWLASLWLVQEMESRSWLCNSHIARPRQRKRERRKRSDCVRC